MPTVVYGVSPIGLGHATRSLVVIGELRRAGIDVSVFSGGEAAGFLKDSGMEVVNIVADTPPSISRGKMTGTSLWYIRSWRGHKGTLPATRKILARVNPDLVVCDEEFSGMVVGQEMGLKRVFIADELELGFAKGWLAGKLEKRVYRWYRALQDSVDMLIIPEEGVDSGNKRYVGPIVRGPTADPTATREAHGLPLGGRMILLSLSGSGLGEYLLGPALKAFQGAAVPGSFVVITGNRGKPVESARVHDLGVVLDNQDLIATADLVISNAGKSTIDEAAASGTPIVTIPIGNHTEQERNAAALGYEASDIHRLNVLIREKVGRRGRPVPSLGGPRAAGLIRSLLG